MVTKKVMKRLFKIAKLLSKQANISQGNAFRLGGEEFALLFVLNDKNDAGIIAEGCRLKILDLHVEHPYNQCKVISASFGVITSSFDAKHSISDMYRFADDALYLAKDSGRNQVLFSKQ